MKSGRALAAALILSSPLVHANDGADELSAKAGALFDGAAPTLARARGALDQAEGLARAAQDSRGSSASRGERAGKACGDGTPPGQDAAREVPAPKTDGRIRTLAQAGLSGGMKAAGEAVSKHAGLIFGGLVGARAAVMVPNPVLAVVVGLLVGLVGAFVGGAAFAVAGRLAKDYLVPRLPRWVPGSKSRTR